MRRFSYKLRVGRRHEARYKGSVIIMLILIALIATFCRITKVQAEDVAGIKVQAIKEVQATVLDKNEQLVRDNQALKNKLEASAKIETSEKTKEVSLYYIRKYFGKEADIVIKVMTCESHLNNLATHTNKDGSEDMGLYQIHDEPTHRNNFQKMYGVSLKVGAYDFDLASKYAKFLWDRSPRNWVCYQLITQ